MAKRVVIAGCRDYNDPETIYKYIDLCLSRIKKQELIVILSGHCPTGVDAVAEQYAIDYGYGLEIYPANWEKYGRSAGPIRNSEMVEKCDYVIAFWDGVSRGTGSLIRYAKAQNKPLRVFHIDRKQEK